jgi:glyceraldehyde 3-phosphate dehydrogenase
MSIRVAINGYGRIGRDFHRQAIEAGDIKVVAINSRAAADSHAHLLKYDSLYGRLDADVRVDGNDLVVNGERIFVFRESNLENLDWGKLDIDVVVESTGRFTTYEKAEIHLQCGAKKVLVTAPCKDDKVATVVMGINDTAYNPNDLKIVSNASCTTNCIAPVLKVLDENFGIESAFITTVHAFTMDQNLHDNSHSDFRRARATTESIIPTTTGAMKAISEVIPELKGKIDGMALRVPVPTVSLVDIAVNLRKAVTRDQINEEFKIVEASGLRGKLGTSDEPLVSVDYRGDTRSAIVDLLSTKVMNEKFANVVAWYDNEWGYGARVLDLLRWLCS